ncbi:MAG: hypothetical protein WDN67_01195 [Candidatus Moraniibacteriota bacterium]
MQNNVLMLGNFPQLINSRFAGSRREFRTGMPGYFHAASCEGSGRWKAVVNTDDDYRRWESTVQGAHFAEFKA